jgi:hypothetical protein
MPRTMPACEDAPAPGERNESPDESVVGHSRLGAGQSALGAAPPPLGCAEDTQNGLLASAGGQAMRCERIQPPGEVGRATGGRPKSSKGSIEYLTVRFASGNGDTAKQLQSTSRLSAVHACWGAKRKAKATSHTRWVVAQHCQRTSSSTALGSTRAEYAIHTLSPDGPRKQADVPARHFVHRSSGTIVRHTPPLLRTTMHLYSIRSRLFIALQGHIPGVGEATYAACLLHAPVCS